MKYSLGISNFLEEISSLFYSIDFLYFFALVTEEGFLISPCSSLKFCIQMGVSFLFSFAFCISSFLSYFPVVMYGCKSWTIKKAEHRRIDAFELWCWRRLLRVPWTARRSNQSILKEISLEYSLEGLMLKLQYLATWCEELTRLKRPWCWESLKVEGEGDDREWDGWIVSPIQWTWVWVDSELVMDRKAWRAAVHGVAESWTLLSDWTEPNWLKKKKRNSLGMALFSRANISLPHFLIEA